MTEQFILGIIAAGVIISAIVLYAIEKLLMDIKKLLREGRR